MEKINLKKINNLHWILPTYILFTSEKKKKKNNNFKTEEMKLTKSKN